MILSLLREHTQRLHEEVEQALDLPARLHSLETYAELLTRFHGLYAPIEMHGETQAAYEALDLDFHERRKIHLLRDDLIIVGAAPTSAVRSTCPQLPDARDLSTALGMMYVVEGATLGGQVITREVTARFPLSTERGCSFFHGYGTRTVGNWRVFCEGMNRFVAARPGLTEGILRGAEDTFVCFREWVAC
jgi:heme oxygenase